MKTFVTIVLALVFLTFTPQPIVRAQPQPKNVLLACGMLIVGGVIIWGLWKICKKIPSPTPPPSDNPPKPPPTNAPPSHSKSTAMTSQPDSASLSQLDLPNVQPYDVSSYGWQDLQSPGNIYTSKFMLALQCSTNLVTWQPVWSVSVFESSSGGELWAVYQNGSNIFNAYFTDPKSADNVLPIDFDDGRSQQKYFRLSTTAW